MFGLVLSINLMFILLQNNYDYIPTPTEAPHRYGNLPSADPLTTENSAYDLGDSQEKAQLSKSVDTMCSKLLPSN